MNEPKWLQGREFARIGSNMDPTINDDWAASAMGEEALKTGRCFYRNGLQGAGRVPVDTFILRVTQALGDDRVMASDSGEWRGDTSWRRIYWRGDTMVTIWGDFAEGGELGLRIMTLEPRDFATFQRIAEDCIGRQVSAGKVYVLTLDDGEMKLESLGSAAVPLLERNYNPEVVDDFNAIVKDLQSRDPSGRLAIIDGKPGTGKTHLVRGLLAAVPEALFILVPVGMVAEASGPQMVKSLMDIRRNKGDLPTVFVIEDADKALMKRDDSNSGTVSELLNLSDGILGSLLDIRIVCTTNLGDDEMDAAVVREGRLSRKSHVGPLRPAIAKDLFRSLANDSLCPIPEELESHQTLAKVYQLARRAGWKGVKKKRGIGFQND